MAAFVVLCLTAETNGDNIAWHIRPPITARAMAGWFALGVYGAMGVTAGLTACMETRRRSLAALPATSTP